MDGAGGNDTLDGLGGIDSILGADGDDVLHGGDGADTMDGDGYASKNNFYSGSDKVFGDAGDDLLYGGDGNDTLVGGADNDDLHGDESYLTDENGSVGSQVFPNVAPTSGDDSLSGGDGNDTVTSLYGADSLDGGAGVDTLVFNRTASSANFTFDVNLRAQQALGEGSTAKGFEVVNFTGGSGDDHVIGGALADTLVGGAGNDTLSGGKGENSIAGGAGADTLVGGGGSDHIWGDSDLIAGFPFPTSPVSAAVGNDSISAGAGNDTVESGGGQDTLQGGAGFDQLFFTARDGQAYTIDLNDASAALTAGGGSVGGFERLIATGSTGDVHFTGAGANDSLTGGSGTNVLIGKGGDDTLDGGGGVGTMLGGYGDDTVRGGVSGDSMDGGAGYDVLYLDRTGTAEALTIDLARTGSQVHGGDLRVRNFEYILVNGGFGADAFSGGALNDYLSGGLGNDTLAGGGGQNDLEGGAGFDLVSYASATAGVTIDLSAPFYQTTADELDRIRFVEGVIGSDFADHLTGGAGASSLSGGGGDDVLRAGSFDAPIATVDSTDANGDSSVGNFYSATYGDSRSVVALVGYANDLVAGADDQNQQVFVKDLATGAVVLASSNAQGVEGDGDSSGPVTLANGSAIFSSVADNLVETDANSARDVFVKTLSTGAITLVSVAADGTQGDADSFDATATANGSKVAFVSYADNLVGDGADTNNFSDLFIKNVNTGAVTLVQTVRDGHTLDADIQSAQIALDGSKVIYATAAHATGDDTNMFTDVFAKDLTTGVITRVSASDAGGSENTDVDGYALSDDGGSVAFFTGSGLVAADADQAGDIYVRNLDTGVLTLASVDADGNPVSGVDNVFAISSDGSTVAFATGSTIYVKDLASGALTELTNQYGEAFGSSVTALDFSADGSHLLVTGSTNADVVDGSTTGGAIEFDLHPVQSATLLGGAGADTLIGGPGEDLLDGGAGDDRMEGNGGKDTATYASATAAVAVDLSLTAAQNTVGSGTDTLLHIQNLVGSDFGDTLSGSAGANRLEGGAGDDLVSGGRGSDKLFGGDGADTLVGGGGHDVLNGGGGADTFVFNTLELQSDNITDLTSADRIDLSGIDANTTAGADGDQAFTLVNQFDHTAGEARLSYRAGHDTTLLLLDTDGDGVANMTITLNGDQTGFSNFEL